MTILFVVFIILHKIPFNFTVVVFSRDISFLAFVAVLYAIAGLRDFRPSIFGKANTFAQVAAVIFVMLWQFDNVRWVAAARIGFLRATFFLTILSALHYLYLVGKRMHALEQRSAGAASQSS